MHALNLHLVNRPADKLTKQKQAQHGNSINFKTTAIDLFSF